MQRIIQFFSQRATTLFFPMALILYDFAAYLTTDLIQPGIINVVRDFNADVSLAPASVSLYLAGGMALQWHQHLLYRNGRLRHGTGGLRSNQSH